MPNAVFHVVMAWKYGDVFVIILKQNTAVITALVLETPLSLETVAENHVHVSLKCERNETNFIFAILFSLEMS